MTDKTRRKKIIRLPEEEEEETNENISICNAMQKKPTNLLLIFFVSEQCSIEHQLLPSEQQIKPEEVSSNNKQPLTRKPTPFIKKKKLPWTHN